MSWRDRPYSNYDGGAQPAMRLAFRRPTSVVIGLLIANVAVFFLDALSQNWPAVSFTRIFGLSLDGLKSLMIWQPITYMFMHGGTWHLLLNMLGLYVCGSEFERSFGSARLLKFYFFCGVVGGLAYLFLPLFNPEYASIPLIGASGAVYGLLMAAVIFFPHIQVIVLLFPVPIRVFGLIVLGILLLNLITPGGVPNPGGEICHIAGALAGLGIFYVWGMLPGMGGGPAADLVPGQSESVFTKLANRRRQGAWEKRQLKLAAQRQEVDRILAKVHEQGLASLNRREKKTLADATRIQQEQDRRRGRVDRL